MKQRGFVLMELLPAALLLAVVSTMTLKALSLDTLLRHRAQFEEKLKASLSLAMDRWSDDPGLVILCSHTPGEGWTVVDFPDESWLPSSASNGEWIMWKQYLLSGTPQKQTAFAFRSYHNADWKDWIYIMNWQLPVREENGNRLE